MWVVRIAEGIAAIGAAFFILLNLVAVWQRYRQARKWLPVIWICCIPSISLAAPSITSTSGSITHGSALTITGTSFGSKGGSDANKPLLWADFESSLNPTGLGVVTSWTNENMVQSSSAPQYGVSTNNAVGTRGTEVGLAYFDFYFNRTVTKLYLYDKRRHTDVSANQKYFRMYSSNALSDVVASTSSGGIILDEGCTTQPGRFQGGGVPTNTWLVEEFLWNQASSASCPGGTFSSGNGYFEYIQNGVQNQILTNLYDDTTANYGQGNGLYAPINFTDSADLNPIGAKIYEDDIYIDDTWARVMIGNASTFSSCTVREIQIPSAWAGTSISVQVNRGIFGPTDGAWLYVIDSTNTPSAGFAITFGDSSSGSINVPSAVAIGKRLIWYEWVLPVLGVAWHLRKQVMAVSLACLSFASTVSWMTWQISTSVAKETAVKVLTHLNERMTR